MTDQPNTDILADVEQRIAVTAEEILEVINQSQPLLVRAVSENLQNRKLKSLLAERIGEHSHEHDEED